MAISKMVVGYDGSKGSRKAVEWAVSLAAKIKSDRLGKGIDRTDRSGLTSGLTEKVYKEMDALLAQTQGYIREELNTVEGLLAGDQSPGGEITRIMEALRERAGRLERATYRAKM